MSKPTILYDAILDRLKNNKVIVAVLLIAVATTGLLNFTEKIYSFFMTVRKDRNSITAQNSLLEYSRVTLGTSVKFWNELPRNEPNFL